MSYILHVYAQGKNFGEDQSPIVSARVDTREEARAVKQWLRNLQFDDDEHIASAAEYLRIAIEHVPDVLTVLDAKQRIMDSDAFYRANPGSKSAAVRQE